MADETIPSLRLFISCPGDVGPEQQIAKKVIEGLASEFGDCVKLDPLFWEYEPGAITKDYEPEMPRPSECDILVCILSTRLGMRPSTEYKLPPDFKETARSGTEYEFVDAKLRWEREKVPEILVWHSAVPLGRPDVRDAQAVAMARRRDQLLEFLKEWTRDAEENVFKGAVNRYESLEDFENKLENKLRKVIERRLGQHSTRGPSRARRQGNPYRGLEVFHYEDAPNFFGRTGVIGKATNILREQFAEFRQPGRTNPAAGPRAFLLIFGASGSGKSSLARAGILPMIVNGNIVEGVGLWRCAIMTPSDGSNDLMKALAAALVQTAPPARIEIPEDKTKARPQAIPELTADGTTVEEIAGRLKKNPEAIAEMARLALSEAAAVFSAEETSILKEKIGEYEKMDRVADAESLKKCLEETRRPLAGLVLLVDQLEELFTEERTPEEIRRFLRALEALATGGRAIVIATLRSDFFAQCATYPELLALKDGLGSIHLGPAQSDELSQMIRKPAQAAGVVFEENGTGLLNERILKDAESNPDSLPLLEFCLTELYDKCKESGIIDYKSYEEADRLAGVLSKYADKQFESLKEGGDLDALELEEARQSVIKNLATVNESGEGGPGKIKLVRRVVRYAELADTVAAARLVDAFIEARLFTKDLNARDEVVVRVTHEALLRNWKFAKALLEEEETQSMVRVRAGVEKRLAQWRESAAKEGVLEGDRSYLLQPGRELDNAEAQFDKCPKTFTAEAREFIVRSITVAKEEEFRACIQTGGEEEMRGCSMRMEERFPESREKVLADILRNGNAVARRNGALLLGLTDSAGELDSELIRLVTSDPEEAVRRAAAYSLMRRDRVDLCERLAAMMGERERKSSALGGLARVLVAADMQVPAPRFDAWFQSQPGKLRRLVRMQSRWLRLRMAVPVFFAVVTPATTLAVVSAMAFKWLPGCFNYAYGQAEPSGIISLFHAATAAILIVGPGSLGLTFYRMVLGREHGEFDYFRPLGAVIAGAVSGAIGGLLCTFTIATVFAANNLWIMGWIDSWTTAPPFWEFMREMFLQNHCGFVFVLNGMGAGIGMALVTNRLRGSVEWDNFLNTQTTSSLGDPKLARELIAGLIRLTYAYCWPLPTALAITSVAGLLLLASAGMHRASDVFWGGLPPPYKDAGKNPSVEDMNRVTEQNHEIDAKLREWKTGLYGRAFGIAADSTAKAIGSFFGIVGIGLGIVVLRSGIRLEPRRRTG